MKFSLKIFLYTFFILCGYLTGDITAQVKDKLNANFTAGEVFFIDPVFFYNTENSKHRLDIYIEIPLSNITFKKNQITSDFEAEIDYSIRIKNLSGENIFNESYSKRLNYTVSEYAGISTKSEYLLRSANIAPGNYTLTVKKKKKNLYKIYTKEQKLELTSKDTDSITFSDILILSKYDDSNPQKKIISPLVNNNVGNLDQFSLFLEIYNNTTSSDFEGFDFVITDTDGKEFLRSRNDFYLSPGANQIVQSFSSKELPVGNLKLTVVDSKTQHLFVSKDMKQMWNYFPATLSDLDLAIRQTIYIASGDEYDKMMSASTPEKKQKAFMEFWRSKDPNPNSPINAQMVKYYERVRIANQRYSTYFEGWKTDMGMIYIMYGDPSNIERNPFSETSKPYEIWEYYDISRRFVFVDNSGFGDYRLTTPIWDDRTKLRY